ncbi:RNA polymerase sigma-54 factor [Prevotella sp. oral taxon 376]|uniref:RNA polymerase factor sigma-54 n=1 Tax=Prevotella sp. oral taxon 376 TaxID=712466 RepID=UPI000D1DFB22|nr:RNA polymerase factor sigma-54 [Prevotella sp. oral taxon 376]PTL33731.1 RNA polymerase sigma-54 factor [Prevotella sp. oral taxon 376]
MPQRLIQEQTQKLAQQQRLTQQQMLFVKMVEMPLNELEESVLTELDDNPALEVGDKEPIDDTPSSEGDPAADTEEAFMEKTEREEREEALDSALEGLGSDDELPPVSSGHQMQDNADYEEIVYGDTTSFYDKLKEQMGMEDLTETQRDIMEYLIGSLDDDGILRKSLDAITDELAIYHSIDVPEQEIERLLKVLQGFDPAGIGARSLQECLLLQIARKPEGRLKELMREVIDNHYDAFLKKHWDKIQSEMNLTDLQKETLRNEILKLNPKPGASLGETEGRNLQQITPDFIVETDEDENSISFSLNHGNIPELTVSPSFTDMVHTYRNNKQGMNRQEKEALLYAKEKVDKAQGFIDAIKQRRHTLYLTMKAIIEYQRTFFLDGDEADLKPMILKDIADKTGLDISTVSRVANAKYAQTKWGTFPLKFFFSDGYVAADGEEASTRKLRLTLKEIVEKEDKGRPLSDDALAEMMKDKGFPIARRTIAKYRQQLGIPVARLRRV